MLANHSFLVEGVNPRERGGVGGLGGSLAPLGTERAPLSVPPPPPPPPSTSCHSVTRVMPSSLLMAAAAAASAGNGANR